MVDVPNNATTTAVLETANDAVLTGTYSGRLETFGDHDWVRVNLVLGQSYSIFVNLQMAGFPTGDAVLGLRSAAGQLIQVDDDSGADNNAFLQITATATGTYFIDVSDLGNDETGTYSVLVTARGGTNNGSESGGGDIVSAPAGQRYGGGYGNDGITAAPGAFDLLGEQGDDQLFGNSDGNLLSGGLGNDLANGLAGLDYVFGDAGDDLLYGGTDNDQLFGGDGFDVLRGDDHADALSGGADGDVLDGGSGSDQAIYASAPTAVVADLQTAAANTGHAAGDSYIGIENLFGSAFGDTLRGNGSANYLKGEAGNDTLVGRLGRDLLAGGIGLDRFLYNTVLESGTTEASRDIITDFAKGFDKINLSAIDAIAATGANDAFGLLTKGTSASAVGTGKIGWYWYDAAGVNEDKTILRVNNDGDGTIEMTIELRGLITLGVTDFNL